MKVSNSRKKMKSSFTVFINLPILVKRLTSASLKLTTRMLRMDQGGKQGVVDRKQKSGRNQIKVKFKVETRKRKQNGKKLKRKKKMSKLKKLQQKNRLLKKKRIPKKEKLPKKKRISKKNKLLKKKKLKKKRKLRIKQRMNLVLVVKRVNLQMNLIKKINNYTF